MELPELIIILSMDSEITGSITIGFTNLIHVINYIWKTCFLKKCLRLVKNSNNLTVSLIIRLIIFLIVSNWILIYFILMRLLVNWR